MIIDRTRAEKREKREKVWKKRGILGKDPWIASDESGHHLYHGCQISDFFVVENIGFLEQKKQQQVKLGFLFFYVIDVHRKSLFEH